MNSIRAIPCDCMLDDPFPAVNRQIEACKLGVDCDAICMTTTDGVRVDFEREVLGRLLAGDDLAERAMIVSL